MARRPTIVDIAREAGVSVATVSNAINNVRSVGADAKARIDAAKTRLGYTRNVHARRLRSSGVETIGLFSSMPFSISGEGSRLGFMMEIAASGAVRALQSGFALLLVPPINVDVPQFDLAIDAAIVIEPSADDPYVEQLRLRSIPYVTIGLQPDAEPHAAVDLRSRDTATLLLEHLHDAGSRKIALITGANQRTSYVETDGAYAAFAKQTNMQPIHIRLDESGGEEAAFAAGGQLLTAHPRVDGVLALVDRFAAGALHAFVSAGIAVPAQMRIATRHDGPRTREAHPEITALDLHLGEIATLAVDLLLDQIRGGDPTTVVAAPRPTLIVRGSTIVA